MKSAFCGKIDEIPGIYVDNFENADEVKAKAYFLSHCHMDHIQGLYSETLLNYLEKTETCLYMSESTAEVINHEKTDERLAKFIRPLQLGRNTVTIPQENKNETYLSVTLIPASHSFGSVMYLFKTDNITVLFTGDFRILPKDLPEYNHFHKNGIPIKIDTLYVDTTFLNRCYKDFPLRRESVSSMIEEIKSYLDNSTSVALHTSARYGYEYVYNEIFKKLGVKVYVNEERWRFYSKIQHLVPSVTNEAKSTKIHLCRNCNEHRDHTKCVPYIHDHTKFIYIHFSAMKWENFDIDSETLKKVNEKRIDVCFATHCSSSELKYFVEYFSPKRIVGFPEKWPEKETDTFQVPIKKRKVEKKEERVDKKVDKALLKKIFEI